MKRIYIILAISFISSIGIAQTKIGKGAEVNPNAVLEIESDNKGLLLPRIALVSTMDPSPLSNHVQGMTIYNTSKINDVIPGFYYNDGTKWQQMVTSDNKAVKFFYMPSIVFDTSTLASDLTKDLYAEYKKQFALQGNVVISSGAPDKDQGGIPHFTKPEDLFYYVTDYDTSVFENISISEKGIMKYDIKSNGSPYSIMNIVFVVKE
ncbi:hypothetical protein [Myroides injenensis]|uniref:hypothetical protein n=1 Tax=Myroides injenensis TaxID=1183151 RepID=UPI0002880AE6|nr:hypothetical protein [Myroides injenensis]